MNRCRRPLSPSALLVALCALLPASTCLPVADDDDSAAPCPRDLDGDGYVDESCDGGDDCDDSNPAANPGAVEVCANDVDDDCDGACVGCGLCGEHPLAWADAKLLGEVAGNQAGASVLMTGDTNGDGYSDFLVGAPGASWPEPVHVYLVLGPQSGVSSLALAEARLLGYAESSEYIMVNSIGAGDLNGDGEVDFVAGGNCDYISAVVYGPVAGDVDLADHVHVGFPQPNGSNCVVASAGDVNGDGVDDLLTGTHWLGGEAYLYSGPISSDATGTNTTAALTSGPANHDAGYRVAAGGDINADGFDDILISDPQHDALGDGAGAVHVVYGPVTGEVSLDDSDALLMGDNCSWYDWSMGQIFTADSDFGRSIAAADMNGDGFDDVIVGAPGAALTDASGECDLTPPPGVVYVFFGPLAGDVDVSMADAALSGLDKNDQVGSSVSPAGDVNGDGLPDLLVGAKNMSRPGLLFPSGGAYLAMGPVGGSSLLNSAPRFIGEAGDDNAGWSVSGGGDINNDGYDDIVVGALGDDTAGSSAGAAYVLYGGPGW
jgi:hypothetical protein